MSIQASKLQSSDYLRRSLSGRVGLASPRLVLALIEHTREAKIDEFDPRGVVERAHQIPLLNITVHDAHLVYIFKGRYLRFTEQKKIDRIK